MKRFHLSPLAGHPVAVWITKALMALEAGYSPESISQSVYGGIHIFGGNESRHWAQWVESFESLLTHDDPRIGTVGQIGKDYALAQKERAFAKERLEDIYGRR